MKYLGIIVVLLIAVSCITKPDGAIRESDVLDVFAPVNESDAAPIVGGSGNVVISFMGVDSLEASFVLSVDDHTSSSDLLYKVVHSNSTQTLSESSTALFDWQKFNTGVLTVTDLTAMPYYFLLMVKDSLGQISSYQTFSNAPDLPNDQTIIGSATAVDSIEINWNRAGHSFLNPTVLQYQVYISTSDNIATLADARANGVLVQGWSANLSSFTATGLDPATPYYFNVVVKTPFGVELAYGSSSPTSTL